MLCCALLVVAPELPSKGGQGTKDLCNLPRTKTDILENFSCGRWWIPRPNDRSRSGRAGNHRPQSRQGGMPQHHKSKG